MASKGAAPVIGIDLGGTNITGGLVNGGNRIIARQKIDTQAELGPDGVIERVAACVKSLVKDGGVAIGDIAGVGLGVPGAVEPASGRVLEAVNLRWTDIPVARRLSKLVGTPVTVDNDVNVGTWGEFRLGAAKGHRMVLGVFIGTGIGGGLIFDGKLFTGTYGTAGEIGHILIDAHAPFGHRTLEQIASRTAVVNRLVCMVNANQHSALKQLAGGKWPRLRSKVLAKAMAKNDDLTVRVLRDAAHAIGVAIANQVTMLSIDCVVIGGGLTEALDDRWLQWITDSFADGAFPEVCRQCTLIESRLGDDAGLLGAAMLARDRLAQKP